MKVNYEKKNIILMIPQLRHGGAERVVSNLSHLLNDEYHIKIIIFDSSNITYDVKGDILSLDVPPTTDNNYIRKGINVLKRVIKYRKFKQNHNIDITYSFGDTANIINVLSGDKDKKIISIRGFKRLRTEKSVNNKFFWRPISKLIYLLSNRIASVSNLMTETLIKDYEIKKEKIHTIYNGYNVEKIQQLMTEEIEDDKEKEFFSNNEEIIITAGTFRYEKGYWHLLKSFSKLLEEKPKVKLVILGTDSNNYSDKVKLLIEKLNISKSVYILGYKSNPFKYIYRSNLYVLSSVFEGFPNALVEAMACEIPVVAADCPSGPKEILAPEKNVFSEVEGVKIAKYGILTQRLNSAENFDHQIIEKGDYYLKEALMLGLDKKVKERLSEKSLQRARELSNKKWLEKQKKLFEFKK